MGRRRRALVAWSLGPVLTLAGVLGCASRKGPAVASVLDAGVLYRQAVEQLGQRNIRKARTLLERIGSHYTTDNRATLEPVVRLALADVSFYEGTDTALIDARAQYLDFVTLYADHPMAPYAQLQAGVCALRQARHPSRDQSETLTAIGDLRDVLRRYPDSPYARIARDKLDEAERTLAEHEYLIGQFYMDRKAYGAASNRFKQIVESYPRFPHRDKLYFQLGRALILTDQDAEGQRYLEQLLAEYPSSDWAEKARKLLSGSEAGKPARSEGLGS
jgi:outer membrane protein assembly factor BamD